MAPIIIVVAGLGYHAIVRWEEHLLTARFGDRYREYAARVPRWVPASTRVERTASRAAHSWRETFFSERGTLLAIAAGYLLLYVKSR